jgi:hypothetical protein
MQIKHTCQQPRPTPVWRFCVGITSIHTLLARCRDNHSTQLTVRRQTATVTYQVTIGKRNEPRELL